MRAPNRTRSKHRTQSGWLFLAMVLFGVLTASGLMLSVSGRAQAGDSTPARLESSGGQDPADVSAVSLQILPLQTTASKPADRVTPDVAGCPMTVLLNDNSTSGNERAPMIRNRYGRSVYLITAAEMAASGFGSGSSPVAIGWSYQTAPGLAGTGALIVYMQNSLDATNTKSTTWSTAISGMTVVHNASTTLPNVTGPFDITLAGGSPFTYTGGSLYVAFDFQYPTGTLSTTAVIWCNSTGLTNGLKGAQSNTAPPATIAASSFRPETRLTPAVALINNDASVDYLIGPGSIPFGLVGPQVIKAVITNKGANPISNLPVTLTITGTDTFTDTQTILSLAPCGGQAIVTFASFTPSALGSDLMTVSVPPDDILGNNSVSRSLGVTLPLYSYKHPGSTASGGVGLTSATGAFVAKFTTLGATSITAVNLEFAAASATTYRVAIYPDAGTGVPGTTPLYLDAADRTVTVAGPVTITLPSPVAVGAGSFFVGLQQTNTTNASLSFDTEAPIRAGAFFLATPNPPTAWFDFAPGNNFKLNIGVTLDRCYGMTPLASNNGPICEGQTLMLSASPSGAVTYSWTGPNGFTSSLQNPSIPGATTADSGLYTVLINNCAQASTSATVSGPHTIAASAGAGGSIDPSGNVPVACDGTQSFTIAPDLGYRILDVLVDGVSQGPIPSYLFTHVFTDHTIHAEFTTLPGPTLDTVEWATLPGTEIVRFHLRWGDPSPTLPTSPISGDMHSQPFGVFQPNSGAIGQFSVPPIQPDSFFDVFFEVPLTELPPAPPVAGGPQVGDPCPPINYWNGNVDISWNGPGGVGHVNKHYGKVLVCPGGRATLIHVAELLCGSGTGISWSVAGLCPGFSATLVDPDSTSPAPNPLPTGWNGWISISAAAGTAVPDTCCFKVNFLCDNVPGVVDMCAVTCNCAPPPSNPVLGAVDWATLAGTVVRFHMRWDNPSLSQPTASISGLMQSQQFGVFQPDFGPIGSFNVPPIAPSSFFDVFFDVPLTQLPPNPPTGGHGEPSGPCAPGDHWDGNVDINWNGTAGSGQVNYHFGDLKVCPGAGASMIHIPALVCNNALGTPWSITGLCPGFSATLVNEDSTPAPNPTPPGWTGFISVTAAVGTAVPDTCCFKVTFLCNNVPGTIDLCAITCDCTPPGSNPVPTIGWSTLSGTSTVRFHVRWDNPSATLPSLPVSGELRSQAFGVFLPDFGTIGSFNVPPIMPSSFFDVFFDVPLAQLPQNPPNVVPGGDPGTPCAQGDHWDGNVDLVWNGSGGAGQMFKHFGEIKVCPGAGSSRIHIRSLVCASPLGMPWTISGLCPGFSATLLNEDLTPAPNPVAAGWTGFISIAAVAGTAIPDTCCFKVNFLCDGVPGTIDLCAITCNCVPPGSNPVPTIGWSTLPGGTTVRFNVRWSNPGTTLPSLAVSGELRSQAFGVFLPDFGTIGTFNVPPIMPDSFFDVFFDVPLTALPQNPPNVVPGGDPGTPCAQSDHWDGNVDLVWNGLGGAGQMFAHFGEIKVCPGAGSSRIHIRSLICASPAGMPWTITGLCPGFSATLLNEDLTPAPNPVAAGWTGFISTSAAASAGIPNTCCFKVNFLCDTVPGTIDLCATTCSCSTTNVGAQGAELGFALRSVIPNPTSGSAMVNFMLPSAQRAKLEIFDVAGHRIRSLIDDSFAPGPHSALWNGRDDRGNQASPGIYLVRLSAAGRTATQKLVLRR